MSSPPTSTGSSVSEPPRASTSLKRTAPGIDHAGTIFFTLADHEVRDRALREAEQVADARHDDVPHRRPREHLLERRRRVLEDHDHGRARILELVLELARRVERIDVDDDAARAVRADDRDRVLQDVRHHEGDAVALARARPPSAARRRSGATSRRGRRSAARAHVGERRGCGVAAAGVLVEMLQRRDGIRVDVRRERRAGSRGARTCRRPHSHHSLLHRKIPPGPRPAIVRVSCAFASGARAA